jgi:hypothetical protein
MSPVKRPRALGVAYGPASKVQAGSGSRTARAGLLAKAGNLSLLGTLVPVMTESPARDHLGGAPF